MQSSNNNLTLTPQSSVSSCSSLSSSSSSSSITSATSGTASSNKKYQQNNSHSNSLSSAKRKSTGFHNNNHHHQNHSNYTTGCSYNQINKNQQMNSIKPIYSEYLNAKCVLYVYFKGDILTAIDDHFQKSLLLSQSNLKSKISTPASSPSSTSSSSIKNLNDYSSNNDYYWSNSNSNRQQQVAAAMAAYLTPNFNDSQTISPNTNDVSYQISSSNSWPYYQQQQQPFNNLYYDSNTNYANSHSVYENSTWNKTMNNTQTNSSIYSANINYFDQNKSVKTPISNTKDQQQQQQTINIKEEPIQYQGLAGFVDQIYMPTSNSSLTTGASYSLTQFDSTTYHNRYSNQYYDSSSKPDTCSSESSSSSLEHLDLKNRNLCFSYSTGGFDSPLVDSGTILVVSSSSSNSSGSITSTPLTNNSISTTNSLRDNVAPAPVAFAAGCYNY